MNEEHVIKSLAALAHPVRLRAFRALVPRPHRGVPDAARRDLAPGQVLRQARTGIERRKIALRRIAAKPPGQEPVKPRQLEIWTSPTKARKDSTRW